MATYLVTSVTSKTQYILYHVSNKLRTYVTETGERFIFGIGQVCLTLLQIRNCSKITAKKNSIRFRIMSSYECPKKNLYLLRDDVIHLQSNNNKITTADFLTLTLLCYTYHIPHYFPYTNYLVHQRHRWHDAQHFVIYRPTKPRYLSLRQNIYLLPLTD